jgi:hypothetical protein
MSPVTLTPRPAAPATPASADLAGSTAERLVLIVAPANGRFRPVVAEGTVEAGGLVAHITGGRGRSDAVASPVRAAIQGLLALPGHLVVRGQALAWAHVADSGSAA